MAAAIPAAINIINIITWKKIPEQRVKQAVWTRTKEHLRTSWYNVYNNKTLRTIIINFSLFTAALAAIATFIQPYMKNVGIPIDYFGFIYSGALVISAFMARYAKSFGKHFGMIHSINMLGFAAIIPAIILGFGLEAILGVVLLFPPHHHR